LLLVGLHAAFSFSPYETQVRLQYDYALVPRRFWEEGQFARGYPDVFAALLTLVTTGFLHADWIHVLVNSAMLLAFGTPVARALGNDPAGWLRWLAVYFGSVIGGSAAYLGVNDVTAAMAVGASGGASGLIAAAFLLDPLSKDQGRMMSPLSRGFVSMTIAFAAMNLLLVLAGPAVFGVGIAWEAHAGGYLAGALLMLALGRRAPSPAKLGENAGTIEP
jgi:membrane associated rhomboid family serine protease